MKEEIAKNEKPPVFKSWSTLYWIVLIVHVLIISFFTLLTNAYS